MRRAIALAPVGGLTLAYGSKDDKKAEQAQKRADARAAETAQTAEQAAAQAARGSAMFLGARFLVTIEGDSIEGVRQLHDVANTIDRGKLASLK
jgi:hypothetical protein